MPSIISYVDTTIVVWQTTNRKTIGSRSIYSETPHPATNKKIEGWKWDQRIWPTKNELEAAAYAPSLWDPEVSGVDNSLYESGVGDNNDLLLLDIEEINLNGINHWAPKVNHGYFYIGKDEWYLYSDEYRTEYFEENTVSGSHQVLDLSSELKPTIPIQVRQYQYDRTESKFQVKIDAKKKIEFTTSGTEPEFKVVGTTESPRLELNGIWTKQVGVPVTVFPDDISSLDLLGISSANLNEEFQAEYFPIDRSQPVELWIWSDPVSGVQQWDLISGLQSFTGDNQEAYIDYDTGTIQFGNYDSTNPTGAGRVPPLGKKIGLFYTAGLAAHYEPKYSHDWSLALNSQANTNPVYSAISTGFVQINTEIIEPGEITLEANLPKINPYLIDLGNNVGELTATVKSKTGTPIEGQEVFFEILEPIIGTFGTSAEEISAISRTNGIAKTLFNSPRTTLEAGQATTEVTNTVSGTIIYVNGITDPGDVQRIFTYKIHKSDEVLGLPASGLSLYYQNYLTEESIVSGIQGTENFETNFRNLNSLPTPTVYDPTESSVGKKSILLTIKAADKNVVDPNTGSFDSDNMPLNVYSPLYPSEIIDETTGDIPRIKLVFDNNILELPDVNDTKGYFVIGDSQTRIRAYTINQRTNAKLYSNVIEMKILIPDSVAGSYIIDDLEALPSAIINNLLKKPRDISLLSDGVINPTSGIESFYNDYLEERLYSGIHEPYADWFRRTRRGDSAGLLAADSFLSTSGLAPENLSLVDGDSSEIPLGFRLKSTGVTIASLLDQVTFISPNDILPSGYFE